MKPVQFIALFSGLGFLAGTCFGEDWSGFRGPRGNSVVDSVSLPSQWGDDSNVRWKVKIPGRGWSQPVVAGDRIFVTTAICENEEKPRRFEGGIVFGAVDATKNDYQWKVLCVSADSGEVLWEDVAYAGKPAMPKHRSNTYASETPATDGERVVAYFGMRGMICYDLAGKRLWEKSLGEYPMQAGWGTGSSPVIHGNLVFLQCDNNTSSFLAALDKKTGDEVWRVAREEKSNWSTPYVWKNKVRTELVVAGGTKMRSYELETGKLLWEMAGSGRTSVSPVADDEMIYLDSVQSFAGSPGNLVAVRAGATGDISLPNPKTTSNQFVAWSTSITSYRNASPLLHGDGVYMLDQVQGIVRCYDSKSGKLRFQERLPESAGFMASPWSNQGKVFLLDETGLTVVAEPGQKLNIVASNRLNDEMFWSSMAVSGDRLILRSMQHLYCIQK